MTTLIIVTKTQSFSSQCHLYCKSRNRRLGKERADAWNRHAESGSAIAMPLHPSSSLENTGKNNL